MRGTAGQEQVMSVVCLCVNLSNTGALWTGCVESAVYGRPGHRGHNTYCIRCDPGLLQVCFSVEAWYPCARQRTYHGLVDRRNVRMELASGVPCAIASSVKNTNLSNYMYR